MNARPVGEKDCKGAELSGMRACGGLCTNWAKQDPDACRRVKLCFQSFGPSGWVVIRGKTQLQTLPTLVGSGDSAVTFRPGGASLQCVPGMFLPENLLSQWDLCSQKFILRNHIPHWPPPVQILETFHFQNKSFL